MRGSARRIVAVNAAVIALVLLMTIAVPTGSTVAVVVAPWGGTEAALAVVAAADGTLIGSTRADWVVIARGQDNRFVSRLRRAGAWIVLNHAPIAGCLRSPLR